MTIDCVAYLMTYELHVLEVYVYGASNTVLYCMDSTLQRLRAVCAATARLLFSFVVLCYVCCCFVLSLTLCLCIFCSGCRHGE